MRSWRELGLRPVERMWMRAWFGDFFEEYANRFLEVRRGWDLSLSFYVYVFPVVS